MGRLGKLLIAFAVAIVLAIAALAIVISSVDPNTLIAPVQAQVKAATGRDLAVRGGARIALSLHPRVVLTDVTLSNAPWGKAPALAKLERLELAAELLPLLSKRFELDEIVLVKPIIALETDGQGQKNWMPAPVPGAPPSAAGSGHLAAAVAIGEVTVTDGVVTYRDGPNGAESRVAIDRLTLRPRAISREVALDFRGTVGATPVAIEGTIGAFDALLQKRWPYPVDVKGEVAGQPVAIAAKVTAQADRYALEDLRLALGANAVTGSFAVDAGGPRPKVVFDLSAPALAMKALPVPVAIPASAQGSAPKPARAFVFPDSPVSFAPLRWADIQGALAIGRLTLASGQQYADLRVRMTVDGGRLDVPMLSVAAFGGTINAAASIDAGKSDDAALSLRIDGKGLSLGALLAAAGHAREVRGGKTDVAANLSMRGNSPHAWASTATGSVRLVSGPATLVNSALDANSAIDKINAAVNPFRTRDPSTELQCAVVRLPLSNGVSKVDRSVAVETQKLGVSASGTLDFRNETLDFTFQPRVRKGISIDFASLADLVRVTGTFASPQLSVDVAGSAKVIASVGAAIGTGGLSAVGQALFSWSEGSGPGPCQIALSGAPAASTQPASAKSANPAAPIANDVGKALGKLFGR